MSNNPIVTIKNNAVVTTSRDVAEFFGKLHKHVIDKIEELVCMEPTIQPDFRPIEIQTKVGFGTRMDRAFEMTRDVLPAIRKDGGYSTETRGNFNISR